MIATEPQKPKDDKKINSVEDLKDLVKELGVEAPIFEIDLSKVNLPVNR